LSDITWATSDMEMNDLISEARDEGRRAVVLFTAPSWCRPCQQFEPHFRRTAEQTPEIKFIAVDLDDNAWATVDYGVKSVPTCWLFDLEGIYDREVAVPQGGVSFQRDLRS
jgi:thiol-disulfide isomerase/thioredoxin